MIPEHRLGEAVVTVLSADGAPLADTEVTVEQRRHAFGFGNIGFDFVRMIGGDDPEGAEAVEAFGGSAALDPARYADEWLRLFNLATLPFYWGRYEPRRGRPDRSRLERTARWLHDAGVTVKGHPLVWHTVQPDWLLGLPLDEVETLLRSRVRELTAAFAGTIDLWDAINEAVIMPVFANGDNAVTPLAAARGRVGMVRLAVEEARAGNPRVRLAVNDFDLSPAYERLIEEVLEAGIRVDAIGLQTHMHQGYRGEEAVLAVVDRFARFGLPIQMTETTLVSGHLMPPEIGDLNDYRIPEWPSTPEGEARQADEVERHYRSLFGHPAVESITYWGFTDAGAWLGAPVGFVRADGSRKPSYDVLDRLVNDEWRLAPARLRTDGSGRLTVRGPLGSYEVTAGGATASFEVDRTRTATTAVRLP
ncbi:endo-1,4-beta-xylanase [Amnibacterium sp.]|uniref:endo-1,4-beta-xylanase n=1 Tax=Amnibacterium sp. TaxID=1872496 RepID=UPI002606A987|nr:endo-1,4-beta-xylanase [Amnibacterium sp.]MCU1474827.1 beta,4-xylanase [Amnibacterium sp.]